MSAKHLVAAALVLLLGIPGSAQPVADLLQKGIYAQETQGNLDEAIKIYREIVATAPSSPSFSDTPSQKAYRAQAQYRLFTCLLQKGDRPAAEKEFTALLRNYPERQQLIDSARGIIRAQLALLPEPWTTPESSQLNIKRNGSLTGEYLFYSVDPDLNYTVPPGRPPENNEKNVVLTWELKTSKTRRSVSLTVDRETWQPTAPRFIEENPRLDSNDESGDPAAAPFSGPAIDVEASVLLMRRLPLAVGYKTRLKTRPFTLNNTVPPEIELAVTAIDPVETPAGKYKCYRVSLPTLGQTFWIGVEGARPFVKFQSGVVEVELVKTWGTQNLLESALSFATSAGWKLEGASMGPGAYGRARLTSPGFGVLAEVQKIYTPKSEIAQALRERLAGWKAMELVSETVQEKLIGGRQAICFLARAGGPKYYALIQTESMFLKLWIEMSPVSRWRFEQLLSTAKIP